MEMSVEPIVNHMFIIKYGLKRQQKLYQMIQFSTQYLPIMHRLTILQGGHLQIL